MPARRIVLESIGASNPRQSLAGACLGYLASELDIIFSLDCLGRLRDASLGQTVWGQTVWGQTVWGQTAWVVVCTLDKFQQGERSWAGLFRMRNGPA